MLAAGHAIAMHVNGGGRPGSLWPLLSGTQHALLLFDHELPAAAEMPTATACRSSIGRRERSGGQARKHTVCAVRMAAELRRTR